MAATAKLQGSIQSCAGIMGKDGDWAEVYQFQLCGRLASARKSNIIADTYLRSIEKCSPKPYLRPVSSELDSALLMEVPVGECT